MNNELKIRAFQHLSFEALKNGSKIPKISSEVCVGEQSKTILEGELPLEKALERLIEKRTRGVDDAVTPKDRKALFSEIDSILEVVQAMRKKVADLPAFNEKAPTLKKKKIKP
jgi:hypothetical protein